MINISTSHAVINYDSKASVALSGQRLVKVTFKTTANVKAPMPNKCASVPFVTSAELEQYAGALKPHLVRLIEKAQDELVRSKLLELGEQNYKEVHSSDISMDSVLQYLEEESKGNRLSKESIAAWFNGNVAELLSVAVADKLGLSDTPTEGEVSMLNKIVADYSGKFQALAGSKTYYAPEIAQKLVRSLEVTGADADGLGAQFKVKLQAMKAPVAADLLGL